MTSGVYPGQDQQDGSSISRFLLAARDAGSIESLISSLQQEFDSVQNPGFLVNAGVIAQSLPQPVRAAIAGLGGDASPSGVFVLSGHNFRYDPGATPTHWRLGSSTVQARKYEFLIALYCSVTGDLFGWKTQQGGRLIHDILPIAGDEQEQLGSGSQVELTLHTEDAFHDLRADIIVLLALRNPHHVETTLVSIRWISDLDPMLFRPLFRIGPDGSHFPVHNASQAYLGAKYIRPDPAAILSAGEGPSIRMDAYYTTAESPEAAEALDNFDRLLQREAIGYALMPGDVLVIDNRLVLHGRRSYSPQYDGADRWLKRGLSMRDLHRADHVRKGRLI